MTTLEHIGIAVRDPEAVASLIESLLGLRRYKTETVEREGVKTHFIGAGPAKLELLEAIGDESPVGRFLARHGEGVHHLAFEVDDISAAMARGRELGLTPLSIDARPGADNKRIAFFHPRETHGLLIEVCESTDRLQSQDAERSAVLRFGSPQSRAAAILSARTDVQSDLWLQVARQLESRIYTVLLTVWEPGAEPGELLTREFGHQTTVHLVAGRAFRNWVAAYVGPCRLGTATICTFEASMATATDAIGGRGGAEFRIPAVHAGSPGSVRLLSDLLLQIFGDG